ncbi:Histidyl-tRNA synthetase [Plasmopara halstedii]|uniref:histidine--tRNA ligase n=1 Tax=Plasmopara halstedii TaxID=4781 RepID=A0A0P1AYD5_PLAHL|nr:Histidyl-tRNA synthetase [Plasmopara halstedii]CEG47486.1 Histidyl-tRNA synthetase [Plasmopara halstedii]|eukprot:XP_024583855.1 Histidyl-tRNA synthetase [Plasmopara halstedii]
MFGLRAKPAWTSEKCRWLAVASKAKIINRVRGMRDWMFSESQQHREVLRLLQRTVERYGFLSIQTPVLEHTDLYMRTLGDSSDVVMKEMYTFRDYSGRSITLRPEGTAGVLRFLVSNNLMNSLPQKISYSGSMFRYERPQRGRYREFQQFGTFIIILTLFVAVDIPKASMPGVEYVGSLGPSVDTEVIAMAADALDALGLKDKVTLELNSLGDSESRERYRNALKNFFSQCKDKLSPDSVSRLERGSLLRILDSKNESDQEILANAPLLCDYLSDESNKRFDNVLSGLDALSIQYQKNTRLVRGLDYYSSTVFEFVESPISDAHDVNKAPDGGIAVLAGGCYDGLAESVGGPMTACVGWAAGIDRLLLLRDTPSQVKPSVSVVPVLTADSVGVIEEAMRLAQRLRRHGSSVHFCHGGGSLRKQMKAAERCGSTYAVIIGKAEIEKGAVKVKNLRKREEVEVPMEMLGNSKYF